MIGYRLPILALLLIALLTWAFLVGVFAGLGAVVTHRQGIAQFDHRVTALVVRHRTPALDEVMGVVTWLGSWVAVLAATIGVVALAGFRRLPPIVLIAMAVAWRPGCCSTCVPSRRWARSTGTSGRNRNSATRIRADQIGADNSSRQLDSPVAASCVWPAVAGVGQSGSSSNTSGISRRPSRRTY